MKRLAGPICSILLLATVGCAGSLESALKGASENETSNVPSGLVVVYDDRAPLLGGDRIEIAADGAVRWWTDVPAPMDTGVSPEDAFDDVRTIPAAPERAPERVGTADPAAMHALLALLVEIAPWNQGPDDADDPRLERRRAFLSVTRGSERESTWQWADPTESGDDRVTSVRRWAETRVPRPPAPVVEDTSGDEATGPNPLLTNP